MNMIEFEASLSERGNSKDRYKIVALEQLFLEGAVKINIKDKCSYEKGYLYAFLEIERAQIVKAH